eukprot:305034-Prymnesium_polylepis.1
MARAAAAVLARSAWAIVASAGPAGAWRRGARRPAAPYAPPCARRAARRGAGRSVPRYQRQLGPQRQAWFARDRLGRQHSHPEHSHRENEKEPKRKNE